MLLCWFPFGGISAATLAAVALGQYDPVLHDKWQVLFLALYYGHLIAQVSISFGGGLWAWLRFDGVRPGIWWKSTRDCWCWQGLMGVAVFCATLSFRVAEFWWSQ
jgi:hypothetical protein